MARVRANVEGILHWSEVKNNKNNNKLVACRKRGWGGKWDCTDWKYMSCRWFWEGSWSERTKIQKVLMQEKHIRNIVFSQPMFPVRGYWCIVAFLHWKLGLLGFHIASTHGLPGGAGKRGWASSPSSAQSLPADLSPACCSWCLLSWVSCPSPAWMYDLTWGQVQPHCVDLAKLCLHRYGNTDPFPYHLPE